LLLRGASARQNLCPADQQARVDAKRIAEKAEHDDGADPETAAAPAGDAKAAIHTPAVFNVVAARHFIETHVPISSSRSECTYYGSIAGTSIATTGVTLGQPPKKERAPQKARAPIAEGWGGWGE
jgi:hypothetical protein